MPDNIAKSVFPEIPETDDTPVTEPAAAMADPAASDPAMPERLRREASTESLAGEMLAKLQAAPPAAAMASGSSWYGRLVVALRLIPDLLEQNEGYYCSPEECLSGDARHRWQWPNPFEPVVKAVAEILSAAAGYVQKHPAIENACRKVCPDGLATWLAGLRNKILHGDDFAPFYRPDVDSDPDAARIVLSPVIAAIEAVNEDAPNAKPTTLDRDSPTKNRVGRRRRKPDKLDKVLRRAIDRSEPSVMEHRWKAFVIDHAHELDKDVKPNTVRARWLRLQAHA